MVAVGWLEQRDCLICTCASIYFAIYNRFSKGPSRLNQVLNAINTHKTRINQEIRSNCASRSLRHHHPSDTTPINLQPANIASRIQNSNQPGTRRTIPQPAQCPLKTLSRLPQKPSRASAPYSATPLSARSSFARS